LPPTSVPLYPYTTLFRSRLAINDLSIAFGASKVLRGVNLRLRAGELVGLIGPNGSGKSSLMRCCAGLLRGNGRIAIDGIDLHGRSEEHTSELQSREKLVC